MPVLPPLRGFAERLGLQAGWLLGKMIKAPVGHPQEDVQNSEVLLFNLSSISDGAESETQLTRLGWNSCQKNISQVLNTSHAKQWGKEGR